MSSLIDRHPGRSAQTIGIARELGTDPDLIHEPSVGVVGTKGDSQCYMGVVAKVDAIHASLKSRIGKGAGQLKLRLVQPEYTIATSDGIRNGTREMRYSLIGREVTQRCAVRASERHRASPAPSRSWPATSRRSARWPRCSSTTSRRSSCRTAPIHPGTDPKTGEKLDIVSAYQVAGHPDAEYRHHIACHACPGYRQLRRHVHLQHHADLHRRRRHAAAAHGGAAVRRSAPRSRSSRTELVELPRAT